MLVMTEVVYLVGTRLRSEAEVRFLGDLATGAFACEPVQPSDWLRIAELVWIYRDLPLVLQRHLARKALHVRCTAEACTCG